MKQAHDAEEDALISEQPPFAVFAGENPQHASSVPAHSVTLPIDLSLYSTFCWEEQKAAAQKALDSGFSIFWKFHFGDLSRPINDKTQFLSLTLGITHFLKSFASLLERDTVGIALFEGSLDWQKSLSWNCVVEDLYSEWLQNREKNAFSKLGFAREVQMNLFCLLQQHIPSSIPCYLLLDGASCSLTLAETLFSAHLSRWSELTPVIKSSDQILSKIGWNRLGEGGFYAQDVSTLNAGFPGNTGFLLPPDTTLDPLPYEQLASEAHVFPSMSCRWIEEERLNAEWSDLDRLYYVPSAVSAEGKRKLAGFVAAGGLLVPCTKFS